MSDPSSVSNDFDFNHILHIKFREYEILINNQISLW